MLPDAAEGDTFHQRHQVPQASAEQVQKPQCHGRIAHAALLEVAGENQHRRSGFRRGDGRRIGAAVKDRHFGHGRRSLLHAQHDLPPGRRRFHNLDQARSQDPDALAVFPFKEQALTGFKSTRDRGLGERPHLRLRQPGKEIDV